MPKRYLYLILITIATLFSYNEYQEQIAKTEPVASENLDDEQTNNQQAENLIVENTDQPTQDSPYVPSDYSCVWHDEFDGVNCNENGCEVDPASWLLQNLNVNNEKMLYTQRQCTDYPDNYNLCIQDGIFAIQARDEKKPVSCKEVDCADSFQWQCENGSGCADRPEQYTSGRIMAKTKVEKRYGYIEIAFRLPFARQGVSQKGLWPAFWMLDSRIAEGPSSCSNDSFDRSCELPWPMAGELDILEHVSATPDLIFHNVHWDPAANGPAGDHASCDQRPNTVCSEDLGWRMDIGSGFNIDWQEWNILGLQWQENSIKWVLNGKVNGTLDTTGEEELNSKMFPIFNLAVGGNMGGEVDISDWSDAYLEFAYIRWYQKGATQSCNIN